MKVPSSARLRPQPTDPAAARAHTPHDSAVLRIAMRLGRLSAWTLSVPQMRLRWSNHAHALDGRDAARHRPLTLPGLLQLLDAKYRAPVEQALQACIEQGRPFDLEVLAQVRARSIWARVIGEAEHDQQGRVVRVRGAVQDVTETKGAAQRERDTNERLIATLESVSDAFFTLDREWRFTYVNGEAERLLRRRRDELLGRVIWEEFPLALESPFHLEYERALATFQAVEFEARFSPLDLWALVKAYPSTHGLAVYFRDITRERRMHRALSDSEEHYRMLFESSIDAILRARPDGTIDHANPAACALFRMSVDELRRGGRAAITRPDDPRSTALTAQREQRGAAAGELTMVRGDGSSFEAELSTVDYRTGDGEWHTYVIVRDITERLRTRRQVEAFAAELAERVRMRTAQLESANAELKGFAHSLAHDLRSLIATVDRFGEVLARSLARGGSPSDLEYLGRIRAAAAQMDDFTQALLSLAQVSQAPLMRQPVDLGAIAHQVLTALRERDPDRRVAATVAPGLTAEGDPRLLRLALENLLANAWKFTGRRQVAQIAFGTMRAPDGERVYFVRDNGAGFDPARADRLFGTFQRLHAAAEFPGTGIGLANVQRIVGRHGGRIWAESRPDQGATFFFTLSLLDEAAERDAA
jgi:PAS domain S-box-containing protein